MSKSIKTLVFSLSFLSLSCFANWQVRGKDSAITFVSTKQSHIREVHQIAGFDVLVEASKKVVVKLDLSSVESGIPIRNERMKTMLFDISNFRYATLAFDLPESLNDINTATRFNISAQLELKGKTSPVQLDMLVSPGDGQVTATLLKPVIVTAQQFGLEKGVDALREIAGLTSIGYSVPVNATILLKKTG